MGKVHAAYQLVAGSCAIGPYQSDRIENVLKIPITLDQSPGGGLKVCFRQLGLDHQVSELHVDLSEVGLSIT